MAAPDRADRFAGSLLGVALGDALGAPYEGGPAERAAWWLLGLGRPGVLRWTDDTQMTLGCARSLVERPEFDAPHLAVVWAKTARWSRGYGPAALKTLRAIRRGMPPDQAARLVYADGSLGNGAAMRVAPLALHFADQPDRLDDAVRAASAVTHIHPLAIDGARIVARATVAALGGVDDPAALLDRCGSADLRPELRDKLAAARQMVGTDPAPKAVARRLGHGVKAADSTITAVLIAALHLRRDFADLIAFTRKIGGDVDTLGAMAGGIWGALRGPADLPPNPLARLEARAEIESVARQLADLKPPSNGESHGRG